MAWVATAVVGSAVIGAVGANMAAGKQADAANRAANISQQQYQQTRADLLPYNQAGTAANDRLADLLGTSTNTGAAGYGSLTKPFTASDYLANADPGYQFMLDQGNQALTNKYASTYGALSGPAAKALIQYNQDYAKTGYQDAWNRYQFQQDKIFNRLSDLANRGENAAAQTGQQGTALAGQAGSAVQNAGGAYASGIVGGANSINGGLSYLIANGGGNGGYNGPLVDQLASLGREPVGVQPVAGGQG